MSFDQGTLELVLDKPYYLSGEVVTGRVDLTINKPISFASALKAKWTGFEKTLIENTRIVDEKPVQDVYKDEIKFFKDVIVLANFNGPVNPGAYTYPLQYQLPTNIPGVFYDKRKESDGDDIKCAVVYKVKIHLDMPGKDIKKKIHLIVSEAVTQQMKPLHDEVKKGFTLSTGRGKLFMTTDVYKNVFIPGEELSIAVDIKNESNKDVNQLKVKLMRKVIVRAKGRTKTDLREVHRQVYPHKIEPKEGKFQGELKFKIPHDVHPSCDGKLIDCKYNFDIECDVPMARDLESHPDITIALLPAPGQPVLLYQNYQPGWNNLH